jgi:VWFA-related protein
MNVSKTLLTTLLGLSFAAPVRFTAQTTSGQAAPAAGSTVTLDVVVNDKSGGPVSGLDAKDFALLDNKKPLSISSVREVNGMSAKADPPVEAVLLIDNIVSDFVTLANLRRNLTENLHNSGGHLALPTSLVFLTDQGIRRQGEPTRDANVLLTNLESNPTVQQATQFSAGYDRWAEQRQKSLTALDVLAVDLSKRPGRKLVIWISPGWAAFEAETSQKSAKERQDLFTFIVGISTLLRQADITLYSVDPSGTNGGRSGGQNYETQDYVRGGNNQQKQDPLGGNNFKYKDYVKGVASPKQVDNGDLLLQVLAAQTGGKVLFANNNTYQLIEQCLADAQSFYVLSFTLPPASHKDEYHDFQVQIAKPGLKARTRAGYYLQP